MAVYQIFHPRFKHILHIHLYIIHGYITNTQSDDLPTTALVHRSDEFKFKHEFGNYLRKGSCVRTKLRCFFLY